MNKVTDKQVTEFLTLYLADCQLEHLEYNDDTYNEAIKLAKTLELPEANPPKP